MLTKNTCKICKLLTKAKVSDIIGLVKTNSIIRHLKEFELTNTNIDL